MSGVMNPGQRRGLMDQVAQGLSIASQVYGIKSAMDEGEYRDEQRAKAAETEKRVASGAKTEGEIQDLKLLKGYQDAKQGEEGATELALMGGGKTWLKKPTALTPPKTEKVGETLLTWNRKTGKYEEAYKGTPKAEKQDVIAIETVDADGNPVTQLVPKVAGGSYAKPKKAGADQEDAYKKLAKPDQIAVDTIGKSIADKTTIATQIDNQLANLKKSWAEGNTDLAVTQGQEMLKILNSDMGKDAVGSEEAQRLGKFLEFKLLNLTGPGSVTGRDVDQFFKQASEKNNSIKRSIADGRKQIDDILAGKGSAPMATSDTDLGPKGGAGTAMAGTGPKVGEVKKGYRFKGGDPAAQENWEKAD